MKKNLLIILLSIFSTQLFAQKEGEELVDSLLHQLQNTSADTVKVNLCNQISAAYYSFVSVENKQKAKEYAEQAIELAQKINYKNGLADGLLNRGRFRISAENKFADATTDLLQALFIYDQLNDSLGIAKCYLQMGVVSYILLYYEDAIKNLRQSITFADRYAGIRSTALYLTALSYSELNKYNDASRYFALALREYNLQNNRHGIKECYMYIGHMFVIEGAIDSGFYYLHKSIDMVEADEDSSSFARPYSFLSTGYLKQNKIPEAISHALISYRIGKKFHDEITQLESVTTLNKAYYLKGDYANAYRYLNLLKELKDSIFNSSVAQRVAETKSKFIFEKELNDQRLEREKDEAIAKAEIQKQQILKYSFILGIILLVILLLVILNRYRLKQQSTKELTAAYDNLKATQQQLVQQEKLASLGALTAGIAHEIKNPLNFITNFSALSIELMEELSEAKTDEERAEIIAHLTTNTTKVAHHGKRADDIVNSMLQHSRSGLGEKQRTNLNKLCEEFIDLSFHGMRAKIADFRCEITKSFDTALPAVNIIAQDFSRVILNLVGNAFYAVHKRAEEDKKIPGSIYQPRVNISTVLRSGKAIITIRDNGNGIPEHIREKIFEPFFTTKPAGEGTGLGLSICFDIIKAHGGELKVISKENELTEFVISIPV